MVMQTLVEKPIISTNQISNVIGTINAASVRGAQKTNKYHPCHIEIHQKLETFLLMDTK